MLNSLREIIERRVNLFGVSETVVRTEEAGDKYKLIVALPGVTDVEEAKATIGETPTLEFKLIDPSSTEEQIKYIETGLKGDSIETARLDFAGGTQAGGFGQSEAIVAVVFNESGAQLFKEITGSHIGEPLAIFLDGELISAPFIRDQIEGGEAVISGGFTVDGAKELAGRLSSGALPVPIELTSVEAVSAPLGARVIDEGIKASIIGTILLSLFLVLRYRFGALPSLVSLAFYLVSMLWLFKLMPVTLTAAGIAGFVISFAVAIDANILVSERIREELKKGVTFKDAFILGFKRAIPSIRDATLAAIVTGLILYWFGSLFIQGFALTLTLGTIVGVVISLLVFPWILGLFLPSDSAQGKSTKEGNFYSKNFL